LDPLEVRFHCPFHNLDLGHHIPEKAKEAEVLFQRIIGLVSKADGSSLSIHIGLGRDSTVPLSWNTTTANLRNLVQFGAQCGVKICLENLAWGWTSKPNLFEKLVRESGAWVTFDLGHAMVCEAVRHQYYSIEDFVTPHEDRVINAHIYHKEIPGVGHVPPDHLKDIESRLSLLMEIGCEWWVIEVKDVNGLLKTREAIDRYLARSEI
jgi:sugar phosphate isomerase/epimerase